MTSPKTLERRISQNRRAHFEYEIEEVVEAGLVLLGTEVKSLRQGTANMEDAWVSIDEHGRAQLLKCHVPPYTQAGPANHEPLRPRPILLHTEEALRLRQRIKEKGLTLVPIRLYFKGPWVKLEFGIGRGKKLHDKRASLREKDDKREADRAMRQR